MRAQSFVVLLLSAACALSSGDPDGDRRLGIRTAAESDGVVYSRRGLARPRGPADPQAGIPTGTFTMGCVEGDTQCEPDELPAHPVRLHEFRIDRYEVTWERYAECVESGACSKIHTARCYVWDQAKRSFVVGAGLAPELIGADLPLVCVTWSQAREYCHFRGGALPTEAQWERAARADTRTRYPWGDHPPRCNQARFVDCVDSTKPVGSVPAGASWYGAHDMAGNAWEWVADWYSRGVYGNTRVRSPRGPWEGEVRVVRGGSFYDDIGDLRTSYRYGLSPEYGYSTVGFRCAARVP